MMKNDKTNGKAAEMNGGNCRGVGQIEKRGRWQKQVTGLWMTLEVFLLQRLKLCSAEPLKNTYN